MALGKANVTTGAEGPITFPQVEGLGLFIGEVTSGNGTVKNIGRETDLYTLFGDTAGSEKNLTKALLAARANGGPNWRAKAIGHTGGEDYTDVIDVALATVTPEFIVIGKLVTAGAELTALQTKAAAIYATEKPVLFLAAFRGYVTVTDADWSAYITAAGALTSGVSAQRVLCVSELFGNELGDFAGRLQKVLDEPSPRISRSPMRVASGAVVDPGAERSELLDDTGAPLSIADLVAVDAERLSVFQWYESREGIYFADGNLLAPAGSTITVIEDQRVLDKAERLIRQVATARIADDTVENTPAGNADFVAQLRQPLIDNMVRPGDIRALAKDAVTVSWVSQTEVSIQYRLGKRGSPKTLNNNIVLDTSLPAA